MSITAVPPQGESDAWQPGRHEKPRKIEQTEQTRRRIAYHLAGHAVIAPPRRAAHRRHHDPAQRQSFRLLRHIGESLRVRRLLMKPNTDAGVNAAMALRAAHC